MAPPTTPILSAVYDLARENSRGVPVGLDYAAEDETDRPYVVIASRYAATSGAQSYAGNDPGFSVIDIDIIGVGADALESGAVADFVLAEISDTANPITAARPDGTKPVRVDLREYQSTAQDTNETRHATRHTIRLYVAAAT